MTHNCEEHIVYNITNTPFIVGAKRIDPGSSECGVCYDLEPLERLNETAKHIYTRIHKYAFKRTNTKYRNLWVKTPHHEWDQHNGYDQGYTDALRQMIGYVEFLQRKEKKDGS